LNLKPYELLSSFAFNFNLCRYTMEEEAALAYSDYVVDGIVPANRKERGSSRFPGVGWDKANGKWIAKYQQKFLGNHATEEAAAQAYDNYVKNGVGPVKQRSSQIKGVTLDKVGRCSLTLSKSVLNLESAYGVSVGN